MRMKKKKKLFTRKGLLKANDSRSQEKSLIGDKLPFSAAEAYKLLRTNLDFSVAESKRCKIYGFISALPGEGKTTTAINTAYTIGETGQHVLLIEADLRLPSISKKINVPVKPGLSNYLVGNKDLASMIFPSKIHSNLDIMPAGDLPPNPAELLDSKGMKELLERLSDVYDTIIIDLPPIGVVTDGLILTKMVDGMVLVVKEDYCDKKALDDTIRKLQFADAKILGFVMNGAGSQGSKYGNYSK